MKYIELYCFTPAGCHDHANLRLSTADEAFGFTYSISPDGSTSNSLTLKPVAALAHPGKIIPDEDLTWEQVRDAKSCYLSHIIEAGWDAAHVNALVSFFTSLDNHPYNDTPEGKQALVWYQAHARGDWHRKLGTTESFNLAILNKTLLADFKKKAKDQLVQNNVSQVSTPIALPDTPANHHTQILTQPTYTHSGTLATTCTMHHTLTHHPGTTCTLSLAPLSTYYMWHHPHPFSGTT